MQYADALQSVNWLAVVVATLLAFVLGYVWYHEKVFGTAWMKAVGLSKKQVQSADMGKTMGGTFVLALISNAFLAVVMYAIGNTVLSLSDGAVFGMLIGAFFVATAFAIHYLYEQKSSLELWAINSGYNVLTFVVAGAVIGAWV